jgi:hypothetical protein
MLATRRAAAVAITMVLMLWVPGVASAHHKPGHSGGPPAHANGNGGVTEDTDDDGFPNVPDPAGDSDNQHPSGKDKHEEQGNSGNQGKAGSDPDGDANGGVDQPGGTGGADQLDQDGNNGCGNDDDFEDDNNGNCGGKGNAGPPPPPPPESPPPPEETPEPPPPTIEPEVERSVPPAAPEQPEAPTTDRLAFTGADPGPMVGLTVALAVLGAALVFWGQRRDDDAVTGEHATARLRRPRPGN